jgi:hypothetical protein
LDDDVLSTNETIISSIPSTDSTIRTKEEIPETTIKSSDEIVQTKEFLGETHGIRSLLPTTKPEESAVIQDVLIEEKSKPLYPALLYEFQQAVSTHTIEDSNELESYQSAPIEESFNDKMVNHKDQTL